MESVMRRSFIFGLAVLCLLAFAVSALAGEPQMYAKEQSITWNRENVGQGGVGTLAGQYPFNRNTAPKEYVIKEIGWMTLQPGSIVGMHKHETNEDAYIVISGTGTFVDNEGKEYPIKAGDTTMARKGQAHAIKNTGKEPLVFLDVIAE
jgi:mannose-6-phosphate isomerase-like protein (cupin superfamily)